MDNKERCEQQLLERLDELEIKVKRLEEKVWGLKGYSLPHNENPYDLSKHGGRSR